ncbi:MAG: hypothetical protein ACRDYD_13305 [Acidimicrobiales bacterium]
MIPTRRGAEVLGPVRLLYAILLVAVVVDFFGVNAHWIVRGWAAFADAVLIWACTGFLGTVAVARVTPSLRATGGERVSQLALLASAALAVVALVPLLRLGSAELLGAALGLGGGVVLALAALAAGSVTRRPN